MRQNFCGAREKKIVRFTRRISPAFSVSFPASSTLHLPLWAAARVCRKIGRLPGAAQLVGTSAGLSIPERKPVHYTDLTDKNPEFYKRKDGFMTLTDKLSRRRTKGIWGNSRQPSSRRTRRRLPPTNGTLIDDKRPGFPAPDSRNDLVHSPQWEGGIRGYFFVSVLMDTSRAGHCTGCWAAEEANDGRRGDGHRLRKKDMIRLCGHGPDARSYDPRTAFPSAYLWT